MDAKPTPSGRKLAPYVPPRSRGPVTLKLDCNEGIDPGPTLVQELLTHAPAVNRYPDARALEREIAAGFGVDPRQVVVTAGADDAIDRVCRALLGHDRELVLPVPTFGMIARYARLAGAMVREVPWLRGPYPVEAVLAAATPATAVIAVVSPNNPTGAVALPADLARLAAARPGATLLVDAAYGEFAEEDLTSTVLSLPNAVLLRTFSKAWGLAGLRVGYALAPAELADTLRATGQPYPCSSLSLQLVRSRIGRGDDAVRAQVRTVRRQRSELRQALTDLGADAAPSQGNFVFARTPRADWLRAGLAGLGIAVRGWREKTLRDAVRITCPGTRPGQRRLLAGLRSVLAPEALLFDMDGVLADVRASYRQTIIDTVASFGGAVDAVGIARAKAGGNANNDWLLTRRLLADQRIEASLEEVIARFEARYLGSGDRIGLRHNERLLPERELLVRLSRRVRLGIVTGRPRAQALDFLDDQGIAGLFQTVVAMEEAPAKPDPAPVRLALERLGARAAWLVGDTPDDVTAARAAGVVPVGTVVGAIDGDRHRLRDALLDTGAATVLTDLNLLQEMLP